MKGVPSAVMQLLLLAAAAAPFGWPAAAGASDIPMQGKAIAFDPAKGNCLACHQIDDGNSPGDLGPPLIGIHARFPDERILRRQIWDPLETNPNSRMPPYGRHRILTEDEIDKLVDYLYTL